MLQSDPSQDRRAPASVLRRDHFERPLPACTSPSQPPTHVCSHALALSDTSDASHLRGFVLFHACMTGSTGFSGAFAPSSPGLRLVPHASVLFGVLPSLVPPLCPRSFLRVFPPLNHGCTGLCGRFEDIVQKLVYNSPSMRECLSMFSFRFLALHTCTMRTTKTSLATTTPACISNHQL